MASNETGKTGWTKCMRESLDFILWVVLNHASFEAEGLEIPPSWSWEDRIQEINKYRVLGPMRSFTGLLKSPWERT